MRLLHTADLHLDAPIRLLADGETVRRSMLKTLEDMIQYAQVQNISYIVIAGDLFDTPHPSLSARAAVLRLWKNAADITFFIAAGNHDPLAADGSYLGMELPENVRLFGSEWTTFSLPQGQIHGRSIGAMTQTAPFDKCPPTGEGVQIAVVHGEIGQRERELSVSPAALEQCGLDYVALGHIHKRREPTRFGNCTVAGSGCPAGHGFDELGEKGFYDVHVERGYCEATFIVSDAPRFYEKEILLCADDDRLQVLEKMEQAASDIRAEDYLRIRFVGETMLSLPKQGSIPCLIEIIDDTKMPLCWDGMQNEQTLRGLFVKGMLEQMETCDEAQRRMLQDALRAGLQAMEEPV